MEPAVGPERFLNRELSWLDFNARVLALAEDPAQPLLERAKFLRHLQLQPRRVLPGPGGRPQGPGGSRACRRPRPTAAARPSSSAPSATGSRSWSAASSGCFLDEVVPGLAEAGHPALRLGGPRRDDAQGAGRGVRRADLPGPHAAGRRPQPPLPLHLQPVAEPGGDGARPDDGERRFARVKVPPCCPASSSLPDGERFVPLEQVIAAHLDVPLPGHGDRVAPPLPGHPQRRPHPRGGRGRRPAGRRRDRAAPPPLRPGRAARGRRRHARGRPASCCSRSSTSTTTTSTRSTAPSTWAASGPCVGLDRPDLKDRPWSPSVEPPLSTWSATRASTSSPDPPGRRARPPPLRLVQPTRSRPSSARRRPTPTCWPSSRRSTARRATAPSSPPSSGRPRRASRWPCWSSSRPASTSRPTSPGPGALEQAGVHVVYGLVGLKTHSKTALVVREEADGIRRYCHVGTGNYNARTARIYEDVGPAHGRPAIGADLIDLFNFLTGYGREPHFRRLLVAPHELRPAIARAHRARGRAGPGRGRIVMKMNSLVDPEMIDALYAASAGGVEIDLIVRGICCLRPGVPGLSENIRVRSIVGRYLEHSRHLPLRQRRGRRPAGLATTSARPTSCPATSTGGSRRWRPVERPRPPGPAAGDPRRQPGRRHAGLAARAPTAPGAPPTGGGSCETQIRLHELTAERSRPR